MTETVRKNISSRKEHQKAMLELLEAFAGVCERNDIPYMLYAGTLLGAVRHRGFIPWDDDIDVIMARRDYERFLQAAARSLDPQRYFVQGEYSPHWPMFFSKLRLCNTACMEKYVPKDPEMHQGVFMDIFPYDNLSDGELPGKIQFWASKIVIARGLQQRGYATADILKKMAMAVSTLMPCAKLHGFVINREQTRTKRVHTFFAAASSYRKNVFPREWFEETVLLPFEGRTYPVSAHYHELLTALYGDYMTPPDMAVRAVKEHNLLVDVFRPYTDYIGYQKTQKIYTYCRSIR